MLFRFPGRNNISAHTQNLRMNDRLLEILSERADFSIPREDKKLLDIFVEYLDRGSLFLAGFEPGIDPTFIFTNDAQIYRFMMSDIRARVLAMKRGEAMDWERIPFELKKPHPKEGGGLGVVNLT